MPKGDEAIERMKLIPGVCEVVDQLALKMKFEMDVAFLILFSCECWSGTLELLKGGESLDFLYILGCKAFIDIKE
jgi:hypothetical protein